VVGEVAKAGTIELPPNTTLNQAVLAAGGFNNRARRTSVELIRLNANGTISKRSVPINFAQGINDQNNPVLRNNEVVNRSNLANFSDPLGTVLSPLGGVFSLFNFFRIFQ
jgi:polysaccharide export outer membrane protein